jgi:hypothetical protein
VTAHPEAIGSHTSVENWRSDDGDVWRQEVWPLLMRDNRHVPPPSSLARPTAAAFARIGKIRRGEAVVSDWSLMPTGLGREKHWWQEDDR